MEIAQEDRRLRACDHQNQEHEKQKAEHVVHLTGPNRIQNEEKLNENATERQHSAHYNAGYWLRVNRLIGYLARYLIGANWVLQCPFPESEVCTNESKRNRYTEPQCQ